MPMLSAEQQKLQEKTTANPFIAVFHVSSGICCPTNANNPHIAAWVDGSLNLLNTYKNFPVIFSILFSFVMLH